MEDIHIIIATASFTKLVIILVFSSGGQNLSLKTTFNRAILTDFDDVTSGMISSILEESDETIESSLIAQALPSRRQQLRDIIRNYTSRPLMNDDIAAGIALSSLVPVLGLIPQGAKRGGHKL